MDSGAQSDARVTAKTRRDVFADGVQGTSSINKLQLALANQGEVFGAYLFKAILRWDWIGTALSIAADHHRDVNVHCKLGRYAHHWFEKRL